MSTSVGSLSRREGGEEKGKWFITFYRLYTKNNDASDKKHFFLSQINGNPGAQAACFSMD